MERKKISNYIIIITTIAILAVIVVTKTVIVLNDRHDEKLIYAMHSQVEYYAKKCYLEENCTGTINLQQLYDLNYITNEVIDPITKEVISNNLEINYVDGNIIINW